MELQQMILGQLLATRQRILRCLEDLSDDEARRTPTGNLSPVIWQVGHLAWADAGYAGRADRAPTLPPAFEGLFKTGTGGVAAYPPLAQVTDAFNVAQQALEAVARSADLEQSLEARAYTNVGEMLIFACYHRGYHVGKMTTLRALLGKPRLFG